MTKHSKYYTSVVNHMRVVSTTQPTLPSHLAVHNRRTTALGKELKVFQGERVFFIIVQLFKHEEIF
jgi:hypothetical protein